ERQWVKRASILPPDAYAGSVDAAWIFGQTGFNQYWFWWDLDPRNRATSKRVGSYAGNTWVLGGRWFVPDNYEFEKEAFLDDTQFKDASRTPVFADGSGAWWYWGGYGCGPQPTDVPAGDLATGLDPMRLGMGTFTMPRHGSRPQNVPRNFRADNRLPGAINISF